MKKILICLLLFFFAVVSVRAEQINDFDARININKDGTINVKETILYDFGDLIKHGIFRTIPFIKTNTDGKKFQLDFKDFSVVDEKNSPYNFQKSTSGNSISLKIGDANRTISGVHSYIINYQVKGALTYFSDHDELYWNVTGNDWQVPINHSTAEIYLPMAMGLNNVKTTCFTGFQGENDKTCGTSIEKDRVVFESGILSESSGLTAVVSFPKNTVAVLEPKPYVEFKDSLMGKIIMGLMGLIGLIWYLGLPIYIVYRWIKYGRDPKATVGVTTAWFDPPKTPSAKRFMTPGEVGTLGDETVDLKDISATIVDLARKGYLRIEERDKNDFFLVRLDSGLRRNDSLLPFENLLIDKFFKTKTEIRLKDEHLSEEVEEVKKSLYDDVVEEKLFDQNPQSTRTIYYVIAMIAIFTGNIPLAFIAFIFGRVMPRKTQAGTDAFSVSKSLKNFLSSQSRQLKFQADRQMMFEKLLPYAIAFGVEKIWAKRFETLNIKQPGWYQGYSSGQFNSWVFVNSLNSSMNSFQTAATPTRSSSGFSSGFSGGFSGGGGGGGGGGSW